MQYSELVKNYQDEAIRLRRQLHRIPEEGFDLEKTQAYLTNYLVKLGYQPEKICDTGLIL